MIGRGNLAVAGLILIPAGIVLLAEDVDAAGTVCLASGWLLVGAAILAAARSAHGGESPLQPRRRSGPTFIAATALAGAAVASQEPLAGVAVGYVAVLWFCVRFRHWLGI